MVSLPTPAAASTFQQTVAASSTVLMSSIASSYATTTGQVVTVQGLAVAPAERRSCKTT